jgi:predicted phosphoadenosine phosphosulfate sulfurtransferase
VLLFERWWKDRGYPGGVPDEAAYEMEAARRAPSWRRVCKSLLRNDYWCKGIGFSQQKSDAYDRYLLLMRRRKEKWGINQMELL